MSWQPRYQSGPFTADQIREDDYYELSNGHPIECSPSGRDLAGPNVSGAEVLDTDPDVEWSGVDAGFSPEPKMLRAPDVASRPADRRGLGMDPGGAGARCGVRQRRARRAQAARQDPRSPRRRHPFRLGGAAGRTPAGRGLRARSTRADGDRRRGAPRPRRAAQSGPRRSAPRPTGLLESRGLEPDKADREKILGCKDMELLRRWLVRAATVARIEDLFVA